LAALLAESLWLSVALLWSEALPRRPQGLKRNHGKAEPFRKESGQAAVDGQASDDYPKKELRHRLGPQASSPARVEKNQPSFIEWLK